MASIVSRLARAASATRASPPAVGGTAGGGRPAAAIRVSAAGGLKSEDEEEEEKVRPKSQVAPDDAPRRRPLLVDENALTSDEAMWAFYEHWCKFHGISCDRSEMERRFKTFSDTARLVHKIILNARRHRTHYLDYVMKRFSKHQGYDTNWITKDMIKEAWCSGEVLPTCAKRSWVRTSLSALHFAGVNPKGAEVL
uniref:Cathepsin propeptide inhibitor domain-containing protein n=1 Tax=Aegilops tauschii TaxID=37682 RepID=M8BZR3_AEGTA